MCQTGSIDNILMRPDLRTLKKISGDGNCLFRAICYIVTGSEEQHFILRNILINYMLSIPHLLIGHGTDGRRNYADVLRMTDHSSVEQYINMTAMDRDGTWGSAIEIAAFSHMLNAPLYVYDVSHEVSRWITYFPSTLDRSLNRNIYCMSLYIYFTGNHFNVITSIRRH